MLRRRTLLAAPVARSRRPRYSSAAPHRLTRARDVARAAHFRMEPARWTGCRRNGSAGLAYACLSPRPQPPGTKIQRPPAGGTIASNDMAPGRPARVSEPKRRIGKDKRSESRGARQGSPASGAAERFRDRRNAKGQLNELAFLKMAGAAGLEPATIGFGDRCSTNSNYAPA